MSCQVWPYCSFPLQVNRAQVLAVQLPNAACSVVHRCAATCKAARQGGLPPTHSLDWLKTGHAVPADTCCHLQQVFAGTGASTHKARPAWRGAGSTMGGILRSSTFTCKAPAESNCRCPVGTSTRACMHVCSHLKLSRIGSQPTGGRQVPHTVPVSSSAHWLLLASDEHC